MKTVVFDEKTRDFVLDVFEKEIDSDGYIVECGNGSRVVTPDGDFVRVEDFAGVTPGSEIFLTKDLPSLLKYTNKSRESGKHEPVAV